LDLGCHGRVVGPFGAKEAGKGSLDPTTAAISNAIYNARGVRIKELPITPERLIEDRRKSKGLMKNNFSSKKKISNWNRHADYFTKGGMLVNRATGTGEKENYEFPDLSFNV
jgi:hypothetical protein